MAKRSRHPNKEIEAAVAYAIDCGWRFEVLTGHGWGKILCPWNDTECRCGTFCQISVWSTPPNPEGHARKIRRLVDGCIRKMGDELGDESEPKGTGGSDD